MHLLTVFLFLFCFGSSTSAKTVIYVRISMQDCMSCNNGLQYLQELSSYQGTAKWVFVFRKKDAKMIKTYKRKYLSGLNDMKYKIRISDKIYYNLSIKDYSTLHILKHDKKVFTCPLKETHAYMNEIKQILNTQNLDTQ